MAGRRPCRACSSAAGATGWELKLPRGGAELCIHAAERCIRRAKGGVQHAGTKLRAARPSQSPPLGTAALQQADTFGSCEARTLTCLGMRWPWPPLKPLSAATRRQRCRCRAPPAAAAAGSSAGPAAAAAASACIVAAALCNANVRSGGRWEALWDADECGARLWGRSEGWCAAGMQCKVLLGHRHLLKGSYLPRPLLPRRLLHKTFLAKTRPSPLATSPITMRRAAAQVATALARGVAEATGAAKVSHGCAAAALVARRGFADDASLLKTPLFDFHVANGGAPGRRQGGRRRRRRRLPRWPLDLPALQAAARARPLHSRILKRRSHVAAPVTDALPHVAPSAAGLPLACDPRRLLGPPCLQARWCRLRAGPCPSSTRTGGRAHQLPNVTNLWQNCAASDAALLSQPSQHVPATARSALGLSLQAQLHALLLPSTLAGPIFTKPSTTSQHLGPAHCPLPNPAASWRARCGAAPTPPCSTCPTCAA